MGGYFYLSLQSTKWQLVIKIPDIFFFFFAGPKVATYVRKNSSFPEVICVYLLKLSTLCTKLCIHVANTK